MKIIVNFLFIKVNRTISMASNKQNIQSQTIADQLLNDLMKHLLLKIQFTLTNQLVGMYIGGSIANNSFNQDTSDIDCYIITKSTLSEEVIRQIETMHKQLYLSQLPYSQKIEVSYIPKDDLMSFDPKAVRPYFNEGRFCLAQYGNNFIIELFMLRENGIAIMGGNLKDLIKEITTQDLQKAIEKYLAEYWALILNDLTKLRRSDYQVFAILTMCRTLYSLETGKIASKMTAAQWVMNYDAAWKVLIEQAVTSSPHVELNKLEETQRFIQYVLDKCCNRNP